MAAAGAMGDCSPAVMDEHSVCGGVEESGKTCMWERVVFVHRNREHHLLGKR